MTQEAQTSLDPQADLDPQAPGATPADGEATRSATQTWLPILTSVLCVGLMALVLVLATGDNDEDEGARSGATIGEGRARPQDHELFGVAGGDGKPRTPPPGALAGCGEFDPAKPPRIEIDLEGGELDLGSLKQGVKIVKEVTFKSTGTSPLCVVSAKSSCGCLKASVDRTKRIYPPGESGVVRLVVDTTGRMGEINKRVTVTSNDPKKPLHSFLVKMDINAGLMSDPRYLQFGNVPPRTATSRALYLRTKKDDTDWEVTGVRSMRAVEGMKPVEYAFEAQTLEDAKYHRVKVRIIHPGLDVTGSFHDKLIVTTTHPDRQEVRVNAHIHIVPRIVFRARTISLGFVRPGAPRAPTRARIESGAPGIDFQITGAEVLPPEGASFDAAGAPFVVKYGKDDKTWWADVTYDGKSRKPGLVKAILRLTTDDPAQPDLRIPIRATVQAPR